MTANIAHFAIHADDPERAKGFYENVFGWRFEPWGPPEFWQIDTGSGGIRGALQRRRHPVTGEGMIGYECTIGVDDVDAIANVIEKHGGTITMPKTVLVGVGWLIHFKDTEGNTAGVMQYSPEAR